MKTQTQIDDENRVLRDGERLRVPIFAMDSLQRAVAADSGKRTATPRYSPGSIPLTDAERQARVTMQQSADKKLSERWKNPPARPRGTTQPVKDAAPVPTPTTDMAAAYARADAKLAAMWKNGGVA